VPRSGGGGINGQLLIIRSHPVIPFSVIMKLFSASHTSVLRDSEDKPQNDKWGAYQYHGEQ
jgi:hypothetical protein